LGSDDALEIVWPAAVTKTAATEALQCTHEMLEERQPRFFISDAEFTTSTSKSIVS